MNMKRHCSLVSEKKIFEISANQSILLALAAIFEYPTGMKNRNFVEDHPRNIPAKFGSKLYMNVHWMVLYKI
jgi:hypothetical protein